MPPTQIQPYLAPRGGLRLDLPADLISETEMSGGQNIFFEDGLVKKRYGYTQFGNNLPLSGAIVGFDQFYLFTGVSYLMAMTVDDIYRWNDTPDMWVHLTTSAFLEKCDSGWTSPSDTQANDAASYIEGSASQKTTLVAERSDGNVLCYKDISSVDISAHDSIGFWIKSSISLAANAIEIVVSEKNYATGPISGSEGTDHITTLTTALTADTWTFVRLAKTLTNMDAIINVTVYANATIASGAVINLDDVRAYTQFTGTDEDFFSYDYVRKATETDPWWIVTNGVDPIKYWDGSTLGNLVNLVSDYPSGVTSLLAKGLIEFKNYLLLFDVSEDGNRYPQRIRWSDTADPEDFLNGNASYQDLTGADWIVGAAKFKGDYIVIFKERSIWVGYATGDTDIFQFDQKVTGAGCAAGRTVQSLGDELVFLGWDDVYVFNGIDYEPIGTPIQREIFATMNPEEMTRSFGVVIEEQKEYWLFVPSTDKSHISGSGASTYPDIAWCFNYNRNKWTRHSFNDFITMYGYYELEATMTWDDLTGSWDSQTWRWDDRTVLQSAPTNLFGDKDGYTYEYDRTTNNEDGVAIDGWFSTKDLNFTQLMQQQVILRIDTYYTGQGLDVHYSTDKGGNWISVGSLSANSDLETPQPLFLKLNCNMVRLRFRNNASGEHFEFSRANIYWQPAGMRIT